MRLLAVLLLALVPAAAAEVAWTAPSHTSAGHPVHAAWVADGTGHVDATVRIIEAGVLVFSSASIHEHDAVHTMAWTPQTAGTLVLEVETAQGTAQHVVEVAAAEASPLGAVALVEDNGWHVEGADGASVRWDVRDGQGRLLLSFAGGPAGPQLTGIGGPLRAMLATGADPAAPRTGLRVLEAVAEPSGPVTLVRGGADRAVGPCSDLATDPNSGTAVTPTWQADSDVRIARPSAFGGAPTFFSLHLQTVPWDGPQLWAATSLDGAMTFRTPAPGNYVLRVEGETSCALAFRTVGSQGLPLPVPADTGAGSVAAELLVAGNSLSGSFSPTLDGAALTHYEFDVRVAHEEPTAGRLVWQGKLHGHGGPVAFELHGLQPGDHSVHVYPSPQNPGVAPVTADGEAGFHYTFRIEAPAPAAPPEEARAVPPAPIVAVVLAIGLAVLAHRPALGRRPN